MAFSFGSTSAATSTAPTATNSFSLQNTTNPAPTSNLFGNWAASSTTPAASNPFGTTNSTQNATPLFGQSTGSSVYVNNQASVPPTSNIFGNTQQMSQGTSIFGNNPAAQSPATSLFGNSQPTSNSSIFGNQQNTQGQSGTSIFGNTQNPQVPSLFSNAQPGGTTSLFNSTLGQQPPSQQQSGLWASTSNGIFGFNGAANSTLGSLTTSNTSFFGSKPPMTSTASPTLVSESSSPAQRLEEVHAAWNPSSPQCRFQHYFYNLVDPSQVNMYRRPASATNDALWQKALRENPNPSCMVPVLAIGFDDLQKRVDAQGKTAHAHQAKLEEIRSRLASLSQRHLLSASLRSQKLSLQQTLLTQRIFRLMQHLHLLIPSVRASSIRPEEEQLRTQLEATEEELRKGGIGGLGRGKLNEIWGLIGSLLAMREREGRGNGGRSGDAIEWKVVDDEGLDRITRILYEQQQGLAHLTKILQEDMRDLDILLSQAQLLAPSSSPAIHLGR